MRTAAPLLLLAVGCTDGGNGTAVGNPGHLDVYVQNVPDDLALSSASFRVAAIELVGCDRSDVQILQLDPTFDALGPSPVEIPGGEWCHTVVLPDGDESFLIEGIDPDGEPFMLGLSPQPFVLEGAYVIDGNQVVVTLSLAEAAAFSGEESEGNEPAMDSGPGDGLGFEPGLVVPDGLFLDDDADGRASGDEALVATPVQSQACGCGTATAPGGGVILLAGMLGWLRRRRDRRRPG